MGLLAAVLSVVLATSPFEAVSRFVAALKGGDAYALMSDGAKSMMGRAQFDAYLASRTRVLGKFVGLRQLRVNDSTEASIYEADLQFEKGVAAAWFVVVQEEKAWRVASFEVTMPNGKPATLDDAEVMPVLHDMLAVVKSSGVSALGDRVSDKDLEEVGQTRDAVRAAMNMIDAAVGPLESYSFAGTEPDEDALCRTANGEAKFRNGTAPMTMRICWADGVWRLRHAEFTPQMNPAMLEASLQYSLKGNAKVSCPRDAPFPVGGEITCRITLAGKRPQDATIRRTTESGWKIVGLKDSD
jgi:hypothetical protein